VNLRRRSSLPYAAPNDYCPPFPTDVVGTYSNHGTEVVAKKGRLPKQNQDRAGVEYPFLNNGIAAFAVFDGHGEAGHCCADLAMNRCIDEIADQLECRGFAGSEFDLGMLERVFEGAFKRVHAALVADGAESGFDTATSGTTATAVLLGLSDPPWVMVANVGDSPCICGRSVNGRWTAVSLAFEHKPDQPFEMARIARAGGIVKKLHESAHVWLPCYTHGLAMSRSLGDTLFHDIGISTVPHVSCLQLTEDDKFLIIASDGLSEFINPEEMVYLVSQYENATDACTELVHEAMQRWSQHERNYRDDITCTVVMLPATMTYMQQQGAEVATCTQNSTSLLQVKEDEGGVPGAVRDRFARRRSVICATTENMKPVSQVEAKRDRMPAPVVAKRRSSLYLSPDMDTGLDQLEVEPPATGGIWDDC